MPRRRLRDPVEDYRRLDARKMAHEGVLTPGAYATWAWTEARTGKQVASIGCRTDVASVTLDYRANGEPQTIVVPLERIPCRFGGTRVWFRCPACHRRCSMLYGGKRFACRVCYGLTYSSRQEQPYQRLLRRRGKLLDLLEAPWSPPGSAAPPKPAHMRWATYEWIVERLHRLDGPLLAHLSHALAVMRGAWPPRR